MCRGWGSATPPTRRALLSLSLGSLLEERLSRLFDRASRAVNEQAAALREGTLHKTVFKLKLKVQKQVFT